MSDTTEQMAVAIGNSRTKLRARLLRAKSVLASYARILFQKSTFDFEGKRLISDNGQMVLQWRVRSLPEQPESYTNQQTTQGSVSLEPIRPVPYRNVGICCDVPDEEMNAREHRS